MQTMDVGSLVERLQDVERRLDAPPSHEGSPTTVDPHLLRQAQSQLLRDEAQRRQLLHQQAAILDALPAHVALLDAVGAIVSVNESWRRFARENGLVDGHAAVGSNYLAVCDRIAREDPDAARAAEGIRDVLSGRQARFAFEYPCHSPEERRWFSMTATPMHVGGTRGAVVMHVDVTARRLAEEEAQTALTVQTEIVKLQHGITAVPCGVPEMLQTMVDSAHRLIPCRGATIVLLRPEQGRWSSPPEWQRELLPVSEIPERSLTRLTLRSGECQRSDDVLLDDRVDPSAASRTGLRSIITAPLRLGDEICGAFVVGSERPNAFSRRDTGTLQILAEWLGLALQRAVTADELAASEAKYRMAFTSSPVPLLLYEPETLRILLVNDAAVRAYGWSHEEFASLTIKDLRPPAEIPYLMQVLEPYRDRETYGPAPATTRRKDGTTCDVEITVNLVTYEGRRVRMVSVLDVTERRRAQAELERLNRMLEVAVEHRTIELAASHQALAEQKEEMRSVVEHMADAVITFGDDGIVRSANCMTESIFGQARDQVIGLHVGRLIPELVLKIAEGPGPGLASAPLQTAGVDRAGRELALEVSLSTYVAGRGRVWTAIVRDVTERAAMMTELELARRRAEEASRAKSAFLAAMSHEIRTPMNGVIGMIDLLQGAHLDEREAGMLTVARQSAQTLLSIIDDILDFSKIEAGCIELELRPVVLRALVDRVCAIVRSAASDKALELRVAVDPDLDAVWADEVRLGQVLSNLVNNAVKFSTGGGRAAVVDVQVRVLGGRDGSREVEISVTDNGIGMDDAALQRLFKPFAQADASTTRRFGGTGLGLTIAKRFVEMMGGAITVRSEPGLGSTFVVRLELRTATGSKSEALLTADPSDDAPIAIEGRLLVAEDNEVNCRVVKTQLAALGVDTDVVTDGRAALEHWRARPYAMLLTDLQMPELDGEQLTRQLRAEEARFIARGERRRMPIVALTANAVKEEADRCLAIGMDDYVTKPVTMQVLRSLLRRWIGSTPAPRPAPSTPDDLLDPAALRDIVGDDPAVIREVYREFAQTTAQGVADIAACVRTGDARGAAAAAHRAKGAGRTVGAQRFTALCEALERASAGGDAQLLAETAELLQREADVLCAWVARRHGSPSGRWQRA